MYSSCTPWSAQRSNQFHTYAPAQGIAAKLRHSGYVNLEYREILDQLSVQAILNYSQCTTTKIRRYIRGHLIVIAILNELNPLILVGSSRGRTTTQTRQVKVIVGLDRTVYHHQLFQAYVDIQSVCGNEAATQLSQLLIRDSRPWAEGIIDFACAGQGHGQIGKHQCADSSTHAVERAGGVWFTACDKSKIHMDLVEIKVSWQCPAWEARYSTGRGQPLATRQHD